jgi:hypothetical protein
MPRSIAAIEADIATAQAERSRLAASARESLGRIKGFTSASLARALKRSADVASALAEACEKTGDPSAFGWKNDLWRRYQPIPSEAPLDRVRLAGVNEGQLLPGETSLDLPFTVPLFNGIGAIVVVHDNATQKAARASIQSLILRIALGAPGQVRFTLLDPTGMGSAYPFRGFLGRDLVRTAGRTPTDELAEVLDDIRRINERVIGHATRFSALTPEQRSGESFEIVALTDFPKAYSRDPRAVECLVKIANAGPRAGRHLILEWNVDERLPHDFKSEQLENATWVDFRSVPLHVDEAPDGPEQKRLIEVAFAGARRREGGDWNSIVRPKTLMEEDASDRVATPVGERLRFWLGENEEGKPSAHAMVAGQTGSGKSYLLHVLISGLAARYSPNELRFTLIDGKQGVEFEAYRGLPHADVVCLRTAPALARSVLADFVAEMEDRYEKFQAAGVVKLRDYRLKTGEKMPRRVMVVDEYQQILDGDPETGALLLGKLLEKGRAAGMHAVLGSQTFEQRGLPQSAMTHIHTWASLSLVEAYAQSLQVFGPEGKRLIRDLGATGEVVLNDEGGRDGANARGAVARLRRKDGEDLLPGIIQEITAAAGGAGRTIVLSGREGALLSDNPHIAKPRTATPTPDELQALARTAVRQGGFGIESWNKGDRPVPMWLGRRFDVRGHALAVLRRAPGQNMLILGSQAEARSRMLACSLAALGTLLPPTELEVYFLDGLREDMPGGGMAAAGLDTLAKAGVKVTRLAEDTLEAALATLDAVVKAPDPASPTRLLVITEPDYLYSLHGGADRFSAPTSGPTVAVRTILQRGPQAGVHTIVSASGLTSFQLVFSPSREAALFNHRVVQQMNEEESMSLFSSLSAARLQEKADHPFAALHIDQIAGVRNAVLFNSYCANRALGGDQSLAALRGELANLRYPGS